MDSYRPGGGDHRSRPESNSYRPDRRDDHFRPPWPPRDGHDSNGMYYFRGSRDEDTRSFDTYRPRPREPYRRDGPARRDQMRRYPQAHRIAERPLFRLEHKHEDSSLLDPNADSKFRDLDQLSDSEEEAMDFSEDEELEPVAKRPRVDRDDSNTTPSAPKWSNPDPYTALPPPSEATAKRTDVLKLIRKARIDANQHTETTSNQADFISFGMDEAESTDSEAQPTTANMGTTSSRSAELVEPRDAVQDRVLGKRKRDDDTGKHLPELQTNKKVYGDKYIQQKWMAVKGTDSAPWMTARDSSDLPGVALHKEVIDFYHWVKPTDFEQRVRDEVFQRLRTEFQKCLPGGDLHAFGSYAAGLYLPTGDMDLVYVTRNMRPGVLPERGASRPLLSKFGAYLRRHHIARPGSVLAIGFAKVPILKFVDNISGLKVDLSFNNDTGMTAIETFQKWKETYPAMPIIVAIVKQYLMMRGLNDVATGGLGGFSTICLVTSLLQHLPAAKQPLNLGEVLVEFFNLYGNVFDLRAIAIRMDPPAYLDKNTYMPYISRKDKNDTRLTIIDPNRPDNNISGGTNQITEIVKCFSSAHQSLMLRLEDYEQRTAQSPNSSFLECLVGGNFAQYEMQRDVLHSLSLKFAPIFKVPAPPKTLPNKPKTNGVSATPAVLSGLSKNSLPARPSRGPKNAENGEPGSSVLQTSSTDNEEEEEITKGNSTVEPKGPSKSEKRATRFKRLRPELASSVGKTLGNAQAMNLGGYTTKDAMIKDLSVRELAMTKSQGKKR
ncbi:hypothetical protein LTR46_002505 [Exophiala xenobiotica]|nr:hypothetical protein LTR46_002505 [Exophiala xenobiotica]